MRVILKNTAQNVNFKFWHYVISAALLFCFLLPVQISGQDNLYLKTPRDTEGPFYPIIRQPDEDNDLIHVAGRKNAAKGDILILSGKVVNTSGKPYPNAYVEIWQTDPRGLYNDKRDTKPGKRDPDFQYWGLAKCDEEGSYSFLTLVPGKYPPRPAHIHFKVWIDRKLQLTSQIYFREQGELIDDRFSQHAAPNLQTVELAKNNDGKHTAFFRIVL